MNEANIKRFTHTLSCGLLSLVAGCAPTELHVPRVPAMEYTNRLKREANQSTPGLSSPEQLHHRAAGDEAAPKARFASDTRPLDPSSPELQPAAAAVAPETVSQGDIPGVYEYRSNPVARREYRGPLPLGDPGVTTSLWRETGVTNSLFRDQRAFQPLDLISIIVQEDSIGQKTANTEVRQESQVNASIENLLGIEATMKSDNPQVNMSSLIKAILQNQLRTQGLTNRSGRLVAKISAMVAEVLPSGILRIEGEKIISVNNEEQVMVISGLVRPWDVNSDNEVSSAKVANMRIDYYGEGALGEAQTQGWLGRLVRKIWPF